MVFSDITKDYMTLTKLLDTQNKNNDLIYVSFGIIYKYQSETNNIINAFITSAKKQDDTNNLIRDLSALEDSLSQPIALLSTSIRKTMLLISQIENSTFHSEEVKTVASDLCENLNLLMDKIEEFTDYKIKGIKSSKQFTELISQLYIFKNKCNQIYLNSKTLTRIEKELLEAIPLNSSDDLNYFQLDIRSYKPEQNIVSFTDDLKLLAKCLQNLERLACPSENHSIYIRKIESGSLKALFGSIKIDLSIFSDLITSISNAIKTWKLTPAEKEKTQAEAEKIKSEAQLIRAQAEAQHIQNEGTKLAIINSQIDFLCEKFSLDPNKPDCIEQIQQFCHPLITYMERNPVGSFNGVDYDITKEVHLLESSSLEN